MASSRIKTYGTHDTFVGIPGGHPLTSGLGAITLGVAAGSVGKPSMLIDAIFGAIAGDAVGSGITTAAKTPMLAAEPPHRSTILARDRALRGTQRAIESLVSVLSDGS